MKHRKIEVGDEAPSFAVMSADGVEVSPSNYEGSRLWLVLSRFAACPFCSVRLHLMGKQIERLKQAGVEVLVIFPSPRDRVSVYVDRYEPPFTVAADPEEKIFELYGVETSWAGELRTALRLEKVAKVLGAARQNPLAIDGAVHQMPADFLIGPDGIVEAVRYGRELDDGFTVQEVVRWARPSLAPESGRVPRRR